MTPFAQIPDMQVVPVFTGKEQLRVDAILDHIRGAPLAGHRDVIAKMPGKIIAELLRTAFDFPTSQRFEAVVVKSKDSAGAVARRRPKSTQINTIGSAMHGMRTAVSRPL